VARKTRAKWKWGVYWLTAIVALGLSLLFGQGDIIRGFFYTIHSGNDSYPPTIIATIATYTIAMGFLYKKFASRIEIPIKSEVLAKLCPILYSKLEYSYDAKYSFDELGELLSKDFISSYDQIDRAEDSVYFSVERDGKTFVLNWFEVETSEMRWSGKNRKRVTTNHDYLMKIQFPHARIPLQSDMYIVSDVANKPVTSKLFVPIFVTLFVGIWGYLFLQVFQLWFVALILGPLLWWLAWYLQNKDMNTDRVALENIAFEKLFDVQCEDQVTSRMILTPAFMDRLVSFVEKTGNQYEFLFQQNIMYVKRKIHWSYLEAGTEKDITKNLSWFLQFYVDMREILIFASDMNLLYLSKTDMAHDITPVDTTVKSISSRKTDVWKFGWFGLSSMNGVLWAWLNVLSMFRR
jgi:Protein of unknown function (DUF3137)